MQIPIFRAKDRDSEQMVEGFYVEYPVTNTMQVGSVIDTNLAHCIFTYKPGALGLVNDPYVCTIDLQTLEFVRYVDIPCDIKNILR